MITRLTVALLAAMMLTAGCASQTQEARMAEDEVQVPLAGSPDDVVGHEWPTRDDGTRLDATAVEGEHEVVITRDGDDVLRTASQLTFLREREGHITQVTVTPLAATTSLDGVIDATESLLDGYDLLDEEARDDLASFRDHREAADTEWPANRSTLRTTSTSARTEVDVELRPNGDEDWFLSLTVVPVG